jgi:hypothetical protein
MNRLKLVFHAFLAVLAPAAVAATSGCGSGDAASSTASSAQSSSPNSAHRYLMNASEAERARLLKGVIGGECDVVTQTFYQGGPSSDGGESWNARCQNGSAFSILVNNDGSSKVLSCDVLKFMAKVNCFEKF